MSKLVRYEFLGNWHLFWLYFILGITIPFAILYLLQGTVRIEYEMENVEEFMDQWRSGKRHSFDSAKPAAEFKRS